MDSTNTTWFPPTPPDGSLPQHPQPPPRQRRRSSVIHEYTTVVQDLNRNAISMLPLGKFAESRAQLTRALRYITEAPETSPEPIPDVLLAELHATTLNNFACVEKRCQKLSKAQQYITEAIEMERRAFGGEATVPTLVNLAAILSAQSKHDEAVKVCKDCVKRLGGASSTDREKYLLVAAWFNLAMAQRSSTLPEERAHYPASLSHAVMNAERWLPANHETRITIVEMWEALPNALRMKHTPRVRGTPRGGAGTLEGTIPTMTHTMDGPTTTTKLPAIHNNNQQQHHRASHHQAMHSTPPRTAAGGPHPHQHESEPVMDTAQDVAKRAFDRAWKIMGAVNAGEVLFPPMAIQAAAAAVPNTPNAITTTTTTSAKRSPPTKDQKAAAMKGAIFTPAPPPPAPTSPPTSSSQSARRQSEGHKRRGSNKRQCLKETTPVVAPPPVPTPPQSSESAKRPPLVVAPPVKPQDPSQQPLSPAIVPAVAPQPPPVPSPPPVVPPTIAEEPKKKEEKEEDTFTTSTTTKQIDEEQQQPTTEVPPQPTAVTETTSPTTATTATKPVKSPKPRRESHFHVPESAVSAIPAPKTVHDVRAGVFGSKAGGHHGSQDDTVFQKVVQGMHEHRVALYNQNRATKLAQEAAEEDLRRQQLKRLEDRKRMLEEERQHQLAVRRFTERTAAKKIRKLLKEAVRRRKERDYRNKIATKSADDARRAWGYAKWFKWTADRLELQRRLADIPGQHDGGLFTEHVARLQRFFRVVGAKKRVGALRILRQSEKLRKRIANRILHATIVAQRWWRQALAKRFVNATRRVRKSRHAFILQLWIKQKLIRCRIVRTRLAKLKLLNDSATKVQTVWRRFHAMVEVGALRLHRKVDLLRVERMKAAQKIQRIVRGYKGRHQAQQQREHALMLKEARVTQQLKQDVEDMRRQEEAEAQRLQTEAENAHEELIRKRLHYSEKEHEYSRNMYLNVVVTKQAADLRNHYNVGPPLQTIREKQAKEFYQSLEVAQECRRHMAAWKIIRYYKSWRAATMQSLESRQRVIKHRHEMRKEIANKKARERQFQKELEETRMKYNPGREVQKYVMQLIVEAEREKEKEDEE